MVRRAGRAEDPAFVGLEYTLQDLPALAGLGVRHPHARRGVAQLGVEVRVRRRDLERRLGDKAQAPPLEVRPELEDLGHALEGLQVTLPEYYPAVLVLDLAAPLVELAHQHQDGLQDVQGLEAGYHARLAVVYGHELVGPAPDHGGYVPRPYKRVEPEVRRVEQRPHRRHYGDVVAEDREVLQALLLGPLQRERGRGRRGLEAYGVEDHLAVRVLARDAQGVQGGVDHPDVGALGLDLEQVPLGAGHAHHVPEAGEDDLGTLGDGYALVHPPHRQHAHRAARPVHQLDLIRQEVLYAVAVDGVGVAPADLHELVVAVGVGDRGDLRRHGPRQLGVPELAYVSQWGLPSVGSTLRMTPSLLSTALRA